MCITANQNAPCPFLCAQSYGYFFLSRRNCGLIPIEQCITYFQIRISSISLAFERCDAVWMTDARLLYACHTFCRSFLSLQCCINGKYICGCSVICHGPLLGLYLEMKKRKRKPFMYNSMSEYSYARLTYRNCCYFALYVIRYLKQIKF